MSRWFRVYDDLVDDPKVQRLPPELFKALINLWCLASRNDGLLPPADDIAFSLRLKQDRADRMLSDLRAAGLIDLNETGRRPHNWENRQFKSDGSTERVKRFRKRERNDDETLHQPFQKQDQTTDTDTDTDTEQIQSRAEKKRARGALAPGWPPDYGDQFWQAFPNKIGKKDALRRLERVAKSEQISFPEFMEALKRYANKTDDRPFCNPATWLNQERWTDVPAMNNGHGISKPQPRSVQDAARDLTQRILNFTDGAEAEVPSGTGSEGSSTAAGLLPQRRRG